MIEKIKAFLTPTTRKVLYRVAAAILGILVIKGVVTGDMASLVNLVLAALFEVAAQNVPTTTQDVADTATAALQESVNESTDEPTEADDAEAEPIDADAGA